MRPFISRIRKQEENDENKRVNKKVIIRSPFYSEMVENHRIMGIETRKGVNRMTQMGTSLSNERKANAPLTLFMMNGRYVLKEASGKVILKKQQSESRTSFLLRVRDIEELTGFSCEKNPRFQLEYPDAYGWKWIPPYAVTEGKTAIYRYPCYVHEKKVLSVSVHLNVHGAFILSEVGGKQNSVRLGSFHTEADTHTFLMDYLHKQRLRSLLT